MESLDELSKATNGKPGFFKHVFNFDDDSKSEILNIDAIIISLKKFYNFSLKWGSLK